MSAAIITAAAAALSIARLTGYGIFTLREKNIIGAASVFGIAAIMAAVLWVTVCRI